MCLCHADVLTVQAKKINFLFIEALKENKSRLSLLLLKKQFERKISMYSLYYAQGACSKPINILLQEAGEKFELKRISLQDGEHKTPEFLKINPRGQIPVLMEDGKPLVEGAAIITYLADKHNSAYMPQSGWERAEALQWLMFANATLHTAYAKVLWLSRIIEDSEEKTKLIEIACDDIQSIWDRIENHLSTSNQTFLAGQSITVGDIVTAVISGWNFIPREINFGPKTRDLISKVEALADFQKATNAEQEQAAQAA